MTPRYVYDLHIPCGVDSAPFTPKPLDGEVESFDVCVIFYVAFTALLVKLMPILHYSCYRSAK